MTIVATGRSGLTGAGLVNGLRRALSRRRPMASETGRSAQRRDVRLSSRRARPLSRTQEVLFIASALGVGVALQMFVLLFAGPFDW